MLVVGGVLERITTFSSVTAQEVMAKTKRRQLAALAAKAEGRSLTGAEERIASCQEAGPSGTVFHKNDPLVEIRTQRVIIKIPSLPLKPAVTPVTPYPARRCKRKASLTADLNSQTLVADGTKRNKRKARVDRESQSENVPEDEAKISKRRVTVNSKLSIQQAPAGDMRMRNGRASAKSKLNSKDIPADGARLSTGSIALETSSKEIPADEAKISKVILKLGKWRREKLIGELRSPVIEVPSAGRQSRTKVACLPSSRKRVKVQQVMIKSPIEMTTEEVETIVPDLDHTSAENGDAAPLVALKACSGEPVLSSSNRSMEVVSNGNERRNRASSPIHTFRRKRGSAAKANVQGPIISKNAEREERSRTEVLINGGDGVPKTRSKKSVSLSHPEGLGFTPSDDISVVRNTKDGATSSRAQAEPHIAGSTNTDSQQILQLPQMECLNSSYHQDQNVMHHIDPAGGTEEDRKPIWQMEQIQLTLPFSPRENGVFLVIKKEEGIDVDQSAQCSAGKDVILSGAELIKQNTQLATINKRLDAAGGLRKWLLDKGLGQFVPIFDDNKIDSLTLLHITMTGLKEMGMIPVGPRRKLMHALNCLTGRSPMPSIGGLTVR